MLFLQNSLQRWWPEGTVNLLHDLNIQDSGDSDQYLFKKLKNFVSGPRKIYICSGRSWGKIEKSQNSAPIFFEHLVLGEHLIDFGGVGKL